MEKEFVSTVDKFFEIVLEVAAVGVDQLLKVTSFTLKKAWCLKASLLVVILEQKSELFFVWGI